MDKEIVKALNFVKDNVITCSEWRRDGRAAHGRPDQWNQFRMSGDGCMLTISIETQKAIRGLIEPAPKGASMYQLTDKGRDILATETASA